MKLNYENTDQQSHWQKGSVLIKASHRVELYIKAIDDSRYILSAISGKDGALPDKAKLQGPYVTAEQALGAKNAIIAALQATGYEITYESMDQWEIQAQRAVKENRVALDSQTEDFSFDPKDVFFDTLGKDLDKD